MKILLGATEIVDADHLGGCGHGATGPCRREIFALSVRNEAGTAPNSVPPAGFPRPVIQRELGHHVLQLAVLVLQLLQLLRFSAVHSASPSSDSRCVPQCRAAGTVPK
jgi:hypothetical protein